jgi:hypothetical protein
MTREESVIVARLIGTLLFELTNPKPSGSAAMGPEGAARDIDGGFKARDEAPPPRRRRGRPPARSISVTLQPKPAAGSEGASG